MKSMNEFSDAMDDGARLWPHNELVTGFDTATENAVREAFSGNSEPVYDTFNDSDEARSAHRAQVRLLNVKTDRAPVPFLEALVADELPRMGVPCDRCQHMRAPVARLWIPAGASIVQVECCASCKSELDNDYTDLVWR